MAASSAAIATTKHINGTAAQRGAMTAALTRPVETAAVPA